MIKRAFFFRCDSSVIIGSGHVMRCLNLATALSKAGHSIHFICRNLQGSVHQRVEQAGFDVRIIPVEPTDSDFTITPKYDATHTLSIISEIIQGDDMPTVIVDHYGLTIDWQKQIRAEAKLVVIDDLADRPHDCDSLINQSYYPQGAHLYDGLLNPDARIYMGPRYALLSPPFSDLHPEAVSVKKDLLRLVIFFGASDLSNITEMALRASCTNGLFDKIDIVVGQNHPDKDSLEKIAHDYPRVKLHSYIENFAAFLDGADMMIGAGGVTQLERCCLGIPGIVVAIADNQTAISENLHNEGLCLYAGWHKELRLELLSDGVDALARNVDLRREMSRKCLKLVDGNGCLRMASLLLAPFVTLRPAMIGDGAMMHAWRNHPDTRSVSHDASEISITDHMQWLSETLQQADKHLLIGHIPEGDFGVLRFDFVGKIATISIYLAPQSIGQGLGSALLDTGKIWLKNNHPHIRTIRASIKNDNLRSLQVFDKAGYIKRDEYYDLDI